MYHDVVGDIYVYSIWVPNPKLRALVLLGESAVC